MNAKCGEIKMSSFEIMQSDDFGSSVHIICRTTELRTNSL